MRCKQGRPQRRKFYLSKWEINRAWTRVLVEWTEKMGKLLLCFAKGNDVTWFVRMCWIKLRTEFCTWLWLHLIDWLKAAMSTQWTFLWLPPTSWLCEKLLAVRLICKKYKFGNLYFGWGEGKVLIAKFDPDLFKTPNQLWNLGVHLALNLFPKTTCFSCSQIIVIAFIWLDDMCGIFQLVQKALS